MTGVAEAGKESDEGGRRDPAARRTRLRQHQEQLLEKMPAPLTAVPLTQPWYLGLANVRGSLLGVIDLARYLGEEAAPDGPATPRLVVFAPQLGFNCALLASNVFGLRQASAMERAGDALRDADGNTWTPLSLAALVREERFLRVAG